MTLDEAIKHCEDVAHEKRIESCECISVNDLENAEACYECGEDHKQLAEWLTELKQRRDAEITTSSKSNGDRIRQMTDEELAEMLLLSTCYFGCNKCKYRGKCKGRSCTEAALEWLKQGAEKDD